MIDMAHKILILLQICCAMTPIWAAFKDFVIESETDLQRFDTSYEETYCEDDADLEFYSQFSNGFDDLVSDSCQSYASYADMMTDSNMNFYYNINLEGYEGVIDVHVLQKILNILARDPRFLKRVQTPEDHSLLDYEHNFKSDVQDDFPSNYENCYAHSDNGYDEEF